MSEHGPVRHEGRDVEPRAIARLGALLVAVTVGAMLILIAFFDALEWASAGADPEPAPMAFEPDRQPPQPRLQRLPTRELETLRAEERAVLESYGWVDRDEGIVRIPIERAMELIAERAGEPSGEAGAP